MGNIHRKYSCVLYERFGGVQLSGCIPTSIFDLQISIFYSTKTHDLLLLFSFILRWRQFNYIHDRSIRARNGISPALSRIQHGKNGFFHPPSVIGVSHLSARDRSDNFEWFVRECLCRYVSFTFSTCRDASAPCPTVDGHFVYFHPVWLVYVTKVITVFISISTPDLNDTSRLLTKISNNIFSM